MFKRIIMVMVVLVSFLVSGCWDSNKEVGAGSNKDMSSEFKAHQDEYNSSMYGEVIHHGKMITDLVVTGMDLGPNLSAIHIIDRDKNTPMLVTLVCDSRADVWGVSHNLLDDKGYAAKDGTEISIMNYRKGITDIREPDERGVVFSTANGDVNIAEGLKAISKLDPDSTIAITIDKRNPDDSYSALAWSRLIKVKDMVNKLKGVNLSNCERATLAPNEPPEIEYHSIEELRAMKQGN